MMLTSKKIQSAKPSVKPYKMGDADGLYLLVTVAGGKYWRFNYTDKHTGKQKTKSYGTYPKVSLAQARESHAAFRDGVEQTTSRTFGDVSNEYLRVMYSNTKKAHIKLASIIRNHVPDKITKKPIDSFTRADWVDIVRNCYDSGARYTARELAQYLGRVNNYAVDIGEIDSHKASDLSRILPARDPVQHRSSLTTESEHAEFFQRLARYHGDERIRLGALLLAMTMLRTQELRFSQWTHLDFKKREWLIPAGTLKAEVGNDRDHLVPITDEMIHVLDALRILNGHCKYILATPRNPLKPISENAILYAIYKIGYHTTMTGHGFRAMASTWLNERKYHSPAIEMQLGHLDQDKIPGYDRAKHWRERVKIMRDWNRYVFQLFKNEPTEKGN